MEDLPGVYLKRFYRGASTAGIWNLLVDGSPMRMFRLFNHGSYWRGFEIDAQDDFVAPEFVSATRRELIEDIRIALWSVGRTGCDSPPPR